jgi:phytol kinase
VFAAAGDNRLLFCLPVAVLTFADAAAALAGRRWGSHRYPAGGDCKTLEGSAAFFIVALVCTLACRWAFDAGGPALTLPVAVLVSLLLTFVEAAAGQGTDNLLIPVVGHVALRAYLGCAPAVAAVHLIAAATVGIWVFHTALQDSDDGRAACGHRLP